MSDYPPNNYNNLSQRDIDLSKASRNFQQSCNESTWIIIAVIIGILFVISIGIFIYLYYGSNNSIKQEQEELQKNINLLNVNQEIFNKNKQNFDKEKKEKLDELNKQKINFDNYVTEETKKLQSTCTSESKNLGLLKLDFF